MMTSKNLTTGVEIKSINYTIQREGGSVHKVQVDPVDYAMTCTCTAGIYGRICWAQRLCTAGLAGKPRVRVTQRAVPQRSRTSVEGREAAMMLDV